MSNAKTKSKGSGFLRWLDAHGLTIVAVTLVVLVVASIFVISFASLSELAEYGNISATVAWLWPVAVDGTILAATVVYFVARKQDPDLKTFTMGTLISFAVVSIVGNVAHGLLADAGNDVGWLVRSALIVFINLVPPVGLLLTVHILASLLTTRRKDAEVESEASQPEPVVTELAEAPAIAEAKPAAAAVERIEAVAIEAPEPQPVLANSIAAPAPVAETIDSDDVAADDQIDMVDTEIDKAIDSGNAVDDQADSASQLAIVTGFKPAEVIPEEPDGQIEWIVSQARAGVDLSSWKTLAQLLSDGGRPLGDRTVQRRLAAAREQAPEAFAA